MKELSILIVEDEVVMAMDLERRLQKIGYSDIIIRDDGDDAIRFLEIHNPDLILCDISIFGSKDGIEIAEYVKDQKEIPLIFVTAMSDKETLSRAKKTLPYGYIVKPFNNRDLRTAIELALYKHEVDIERKTPSLAKISQIAQPDLSLREYEILKNLLTGATNEQIAKDQFISVNTVKFHTSNIYQKLNVKNRSAAINKVINLLYK